MTCNQTPNIHNTVLLQGSGGQIILCCQKKRFDTRDAASDWQQQTDELPLRFNPQFLIKILNTKPSTHTVWEESQGRTLVENFFILVKRVICVVTSLTTFCLLQYCASQMELISIVLCEAMLRCKIASLSVCDKWQHVTPVPYFQFSVSIITITIKFRTPDWIITSKIRKCSTVCCTTCVETFHSHPHRHY